MGFASGSVSFRRFAVIGEQPETINEALLEKLAQHALKVADLGLPEEVEYGWCGGRHVLDGNFSFEHNVYADALVFAMRMDTNKVPGELKRAYAIMEEEAIAATNPSGFISKSQKREVKDSVRKRMDEELREGRYRRSKMIPVVWDLPSQTVYCSASGKMMEQLMELFERSFGLMLHPLSAGSIALRMLEPKGKRRDYEDFRPTRFVPGPGGEGEYPDYPWVLKGPEPKDFLGNEFLLWLWQQAEGKHQGVATSAGDVAVMFDKSLDLDCAYGQSGRDSLRGDGPHRSPEARDALRTGKLPRKAGMILESSGLQFSLNFNAETFAIGSAKLPDIEEAETPRVVFEERIALLRTLSQTIDAMFEEFLKVRASSAWEGRISDARRWILTTGQKPIAAVA